MPQFSYNHRTGEPVPWKRSRQPRTWRGNEHDPAASHFSFGL
ncbi:MAG: hypothetical protein ACR2LR_12550 [Hassallia sp.]